MASFRLFIIALTASIFALWHFEVALAQFPIACLENATLPDAVCCPIPEGFTAPCGGKKRGKCSKIRIAVSEEQNATRLAGLPEQLWQDDRIDWPTRFYSYYCKCSGKYHGYACQECRPGYTGLNCKEKATRVRRNVLSLSVEDQRILRDVINASKYTPSEYAVMNLANNRSADPVNAENLLFYNVSVYDYMVYVHFYASRSTMVNERMDKCNPELQVLDFAHKGPVFLPWHRQYLLMFEHELAKIAFTQFNVSNFSLAYWDWTARPDSSNSSFACPICTNDLIGEIVEAADGQAGAISPDSPFAQWHPICQQRPEEDDCHVCDLVAAEARWENSSSSGAYWEPGYLWRELSGNEEWSELPTQEDINNTMSAPYYDELPYNASSSNSSFRNCIEGFAQLGSKPGPFNMHNLIHSYFNGTWFDPATSPNDPLFLFHHAFVDKLYELWLSSKTEKQRKINNTDEAALPHNMMNFMVPFFPPVRMLSISKKLSKKFGYIYDDNLAGDVPIIAVPKKLSSGIFFADESGETAGINSTALFSIQLAVSIVVLAAIVALIFIGRNIHRRLTHRPYTEISQEFGSTQSMERGTMKNRNATSLSTSSERTPLLSSRL